MKADPTVLPSALRTVAETTGLQFVPNVVGETGVIPIACPRLPLDENLSVILAGLPTAVNFHRVVLDMDKKEDQAEYERVMGYMAANYGGRVTYLERKFIRKTVVTKDGKKKKQCVQRIFLEYFAPYRVLPPKFETATVPEPMIPF